MGTTRYRHSRAVLLATCAAFAACSPAMTAPRAAASPTAESRVYDVRAARYVDPRSLAKALSSADVVFFGEQHDDPATHRAELAYLAAVGARRPNVVVSLEMFERDVQPALDSYLKGDIAEPALIASARPWPNYVNDYRPLVELARANGWPVVASNIPRRMASAIGKAGIGFLDTIPSGDRAFVARELKCPRDQYYERFAAEMTGHSAGSTPGAPDANAAAMTNRFYEAQCAKDETMAESIVAALGRAGSDAILVHFNGAFHSNSGLGTAERVRRRRPDLKALVVTAVPVDAVATADAAAYKTLGDYIVLTPKPPKAPAAPTR